jgi:hypothetical protein
MRRASPLVHAGARQGSLTKSYEVLFTHRGLPQNPVSHVDLEMLAVAGFRQKCPGVIQGRADHFDSIGS